MTKKIRGRIVFEMNIEKWEIRGDLVVIGHHVARLRRAVSAGKVFHHGVSGNLPYARAACGSCVGGLWKNALSVKCPPTPKGVAGLTEFFILQCFTFQSCRHSACGVAVKADKCSVMEIRGIYHLRSRGANYDNLEGCEAPGWA